MTVLARPALRPLRAGQILDRALRIYRRHFLQFVGVIALVQVPLVLVQLLASLLTFGNTFSRLEEILNNPAAVPDSPFSILGPAYAAGASLNWLVTILSFILVQGVATAALTRATADSYLGEAASGIVDTYRRSRGSWVSLIGALLLVVVISILLFLWTLVPCVGWLTGGGLLFFLWLVIVPLLAPVVVLEQQPAAVAWRRAWSLARQRFWWVLGFGLILYLFNLLVVAGPAALVGFAGQFIIGDPLTPSGPSFVLQTVVQSLTNLVTSLFYLPIQVAGATLLYLDLRVRGEGLVLSALAAAEPRLEAEDAPPAYLESLASSAPAPATAGGQLLTTTEMGNFALLTLGFFAVLGLLLGGFFLLGFGLAAALGASGA